MSGLELWLRTVCALAIIALVLGALRYLLRRLNGAAPVRRGGRLLQVLETLPLSHACVLHVVRIADRYFALGSAQGSVQIVCEVHADAVVTR